MSTGGASETGSPEQSHVVEALIDALAQIDLCRGDDGAFEDQVDVTETMFRRGELSAPEAAERLGLSLEEFVRDFVLTDRSEDAAGGEPAQSDRAAVLAAILRRMQDGISVEDFACETLADVVGEVVVRTVSPTSPLGAQPLGQVLRNELSTGATLETVVAKFVLPERLRLQLGVARERWTQLVAAGVTALSQREEFVWNAAWFTALDYPRRADNRAIEALDVALSERRIAEASRQIASHGHREAAIAPLEPQATTQVWCYARWIQFDFSFLEVTTRALRAFSRVPLTSLPPEGRMRLRLAEAMVSFYLERYDDVLTALSIGRRVRAASREADRLRAWSTYFEANVYWKRGKYDRARALLEHALATWSVQLAAAETAAFQLLLGWLQFLDGRMSEARETLAMASAAFRRTDDHLSRGDFESFEGRLAREVGDHGTARSWFARSIQSYSKIDVTHPNIGRSHINVATSLRHEAKRVQARDGRRRTALLSRALSHLDAAEAIYRTTQRPSTRGLVRVHVERAHAFYDVNERNRVERHASLALRLAEQMRNPLLIAEAKGLLAIASPNPIIAARALNEARAHADDTDSAGLKAKLRRLSAGVGELASVDDHHGGQP
jgi:tetratricopeptide (TPR) repeat protein